MGVALDRQALEGWVIQASAEDIKDLIGFAKGVLAARPARKRRRDAVRRRVVADDAGQKGGSYDTAAK
jgi:hypothetical protein